MNGRNWGAGGTLAAAMLFAACSGDGPGNPAGTAGGSDGGAVAVAISPHAAAAQPGGTVQFTAATTGADGSAVPAAVHFAAQGGSVTQGGLFTAPAAAGTYVVVATLDGGQADTARVTVAAPAPGVTLVGLTLAPAAASVAAGATLRFTAAGRFSDGTTSASPVTWSATGGSIDAGGLYTAGLVAGTYRVKAHSGSVSDSVAVTVTALPPPPGGGGGNGTFVPVVGDDWHGYASKAQLDARQYFWWFDSRNVNDYVGLVQDPTFGQVARISFPQNSGSPGSSPRLARPLPTPLGDVWYRWKMRFTPGWTTVGPDPSGSANSYKVAFIEWESGFASRGELEISNSTEYITGVGVQDASGAYLHYTETLLPGSAPNFGTVTTEWSDGEWYEYVLHYKKTGPTSALYQYYRRRLTSGGKLAAGAWTYHGMALSGSPTPRVAQVELGANKNKNNPTTMSIEWGPWEVVDGSVYANPFGLPNAQ